MLNKSTAQIIFSTNMSRYLTATTKNIIIKRTINYQHIRSFSSIATLSDSHHEPEDTGESHFHGNNFPQIITNSDALAPCSTNNTNISYRRVWKSSGDNTDGDEYSTTWTKSVHADSKNGRLQTDLERITEQERQGGRMRAKQLGVVHDDPAEDMRRLCQSHTAPTLASALRDREELLQLCAKLISENNIDRLRQILHPYKRENVLARRMKGKILDLSSSSSKPGGGGGGGGFDHQSLEMLRIGLMKMPRMVSQAHQRRAGVVLPICNVDGIPCVLLEKRSRHLRAHPDEVCLPGGMVCTKNDKSIVSTCLREMTDEITGINAGDVTVLGVLRCNWGEVAKLTGVAVTPVLCFLGDIGDIDLCPNEDKVAECFTIPLESLLNKDLWIHKEDSAPIFTGGPHIIWGLTGYILDKFVRDLLVSYTIRLPTRNMEVYTK